MPEIERLVLAGALVGEAKMDMKVEDGKVTTFRTRVALSFKYETS